jgi:tetratricopeptide (TPR) repeat protein
MQAGKGNVSTNSFELQPFERQPERMEESGKRIQGISIRFRWRVETAQSRAALGVVALSIAYSIVRVLPRSNVRKHKYLESGQKYSAQGKDREAAIQFSNALKIDKNFADAHYALAQTYLHMGALSAAYRRTPADGGLQPTNYKARIDLGNMFLPEARSTTRRRRPPRSWRSAEQCRCSRLLSRIAARRGQKDLALTEIHRALELAPNEAALHETLHCSKRVIPLRHLPLKTN